jgi:hypothetical protein
MITQLDDKTRIKLKFHLPALSSALCLQRKKRYGWTTVSWIYPSIMKHSTCEYIRYWLEWEENNSKEQLKSQREIGKELMTKCGGKF